MEPLDNADAIDADSEIEAEADRDSARRVERAIQILLAERRRQSGRLEFDDFSRVVARRGLDISERHQVLTSLRDGGVELTDSSATQDGEASVSNGESQANRFWRDLIPNYDANRRLLSHDEEIRLGRRVRSFLYTDDDPPDDFDNEDVEHVESVSNDAKEQLILHNLRLVAKIAGEWLGQRSIPKEDLFQAGIVGLNRAVEKYDPEKGFRFSTYATH